MATSTGAPHLSLAWNRYDDGALKVQPILHNSRCVNVKSSSRHAIEAAGYRWKHVDGDETYHCERQVRK